MTINPNLSVYRVPFTVTLTGAAFIIAESERDALDKAAVADIGDYLSVEDDDATIDPEQGELTDFGPVALTDDPSQVAHTDYAVEDHPDYDPTEHDEPADEGEPDPTPTDLPRPGEGLKS